MAADRPVTEKELMALFDKIDTDQSGTLELNEFHAEYISKGFSEAEIKVCFSILK